MRKEGEKTPPLRKGCPGGFYLMPGMTREAAWSIPDDTNDVDKQTDIGIQ